MGYITPAQLKDFATAVHSELELRALEQDVKDGTITVGLAEKAESVKSDGVQDGKVLAADGNGGIKWVNGGGGGGGAVDSVNGKTGDVVLSKADILADMDTTARIYCIQFNTTGSKPKVNSGLYAQGSLHYKHDILTTSQLRALLKQGDIKFIIPFNSSGYGLSEIYVDKGVGKTTEDCVFYVIEEIGINRIKYFKFVMPASTTVGLTRVYYYDTGELGGSTVVANPPLAGTEECITGIKINNVGYQLAGTEPKYLTLYETFSNTDFVGITYAQSSPTDVLYGSYLPSNGALGGAVIHFLQAYFPVQNRVPSNMTINSVGVGIYPRVSVSDGHPTTLLETTDCFVYFSDNFWDSANERYVDRIYSSENLPYMDQVIESGRTDISKTTIAPSSIFQNCMLVTVGVHDDNDQYYTYKFLVQFTVYRTIFADWTLPALFDAIYPTWESGGSGSGSGSGSGDDSNEEYNYEE